MARAKFLIFETWLPQFAEGKAHLEFELIGGQKAAAYQPFQFGTDYLEAAQAENSAERIAIRYDTIAVVRGPAETTENFNRPLR